jgi:hypothetical protein
MCCVPEMRMSKFQAKLASVVLIGVAANVGLMAAPGSAARAADNCLAEPKGETPQGRHWFYRTDRGTGRHCWYLRGEDESSAHAPSAEPVAAVKPAPQSAGNAPARSLADARAEFTPKNRIADNSARPARSVFPDPPPVLTAGSGPGAAAPAMPADSQVTPSWPQASGAPAQANSDASRMVADTQPEDQAATTPPPATSAQANAPMTREVGSLQKLLLVAFGALALAGITGSAVYRLAGARKRRRYQQRWPERLQPPSLSLAEQTGGAPWVAPELSPTVPDTDLPSDVESHDDQRGDDSFEKIEDFLARLTRQLQTELETNRAAALENPRAH